jgi:hypothetical protein
MEGVSLAGRGSWRGAFICEEWWGQGTRVYSWVRAIIDGPCGTVALWGIVGTTVGSMSSGRDNTRDIVGRAAVHSSGRGSNNSSSIVVVEGDSNTTWRRQQRQRASV